MNSNESILSNKAVVSGLSLALIVAIAAAGWYFYNQEQEKKKQVKDQEALNEVTSGVQALWNADNEQAVSQLEVASENAQTAFTKAAAEFNLASAMHLAGDKAGAIEKLKALEANKEYPPYFRARAVEYMARMFFLTHDAEVFRMVFTGKPYDDFEIDGAKDVSIRNLLEYGETIYPLGLAQLKIARLYGEDMIEKKSKDPKTIELIKSYIENAEDEIATADSVQKRNLIARKAIAVGWLYELGDHSYGDPEKYFKELMALEHNQQHSNKAVPGEKIRYAMFLARNYGTSRSADIKKLLSEATNSPAFKLSNIYEVINNERFELGKIAPSNSVAYDIAVLEKNPALSFDAKSLILLAKIDPAFKTTLMNLGWNIK